MDARFATDALARQNITTMPFRFSQTPATISKRASKLGEHTDAILSELGLSEDEIASLRGRKIV